MDKPYEWPRFGEGDGAWCHLPILWVVAVLGLGFFFWAMDQEPYPWGPPWRRPSHYSKMSWQEKSAWQAANEK